MKTVKNKKQPEPIGWLIRKGRIGANIGYCFEVYRDWPYHDRPFPNMVSALYKTRFEADRELDKYLSS